MGRASKEAKPKESRENKVADLEKKVKSLVSNSQYIRYIVY